MKKSLSLSRRFAVLDSGIGGLAIFFILRQAAPGAGSIYFADHARFPYGALSKAELEARLRLWAETAERLGVTDLIIGCNTAAAVWERARMQAEFPDLRVYSVVDAGARAIVWSRLERVGVAGTPLMIESGGYEAAVRIYEINHQVKLVPLALPKLAKVIESGEEESGEAGKIIATAAAQFVEKGVQAVVLACTHFPRCLDLWRRALPPDVHLIDPATVLGNDVYCAAFGLHGTQSATYYATGDGDAFARAAAHVLGYNPLVRSLALEAPLERVA